MPLTSATLRIGSALDCDLQIADPTFTGLDLAVMAQKGGYLLRDRHMARGLITSGVKVNEAVLGLNEPVYAPNAQGKALSALLRPLAHGSALGRRDGAMQAQTIRFRPDQDTLTLGRDTGNDVVVDYPLVSRFHAQIERLAHHVLLHDLRSTNGSFVDGQRVQGLQELQIGNEIQIGPVRFVFRGEAIEQIDGQPRVRLDAVDLVRHAGRRGGKILLDKVSLSVLPQEFIALIGGSGAGKSTLLHALAGVAPAQEGAVLYNGQDYYRQPGAYGGLIGYVPQDDILHRDLTVRRALAYAARLRLPPDTSPAERERRIDAVLADVQMAPQRDQPITRLSGGQRKRVSIAVELLANPSVLFLDEPTSGLDPGLDKTVMRLLGELCEQGRTVVLVTHATENIGQCDLVAFLAGGRLVYYGPPDQAPSHFGAQTFPDIYTLLADPAQSAPRELRFRQSAPYRTYVLERQASDAVPALPVVMTTPHSRRQLRASALRQWAILTQRYAELVGRDRVNLALLLAQTPIVAAALSLVASRDMYTGPKINNTQQILLMLGIATLWFGTSNAAREIVKERPVYLRERMVNLRLFPYILSKVGVLAVLGVLQVLVLFVIISLKTRHLPSQGILLPAPIEMVISLSLCALAGLLGGLLISSLVRSTDRAMSIVPIVLIPQVIFSGAVFDLSGWAKVLSYLTISHWCLAALGSTVKINEMATRLPIDDRIVQVNRGTAPLPDVIANWPKEMYSSPDQVHLLGYWGALGIFCILFLLGTYVALRRGDIGAAKGREKTRGRTLLLLTAPPVLLCTVMLLISSLHASGQTLPVPRSTAAATSALPGAARRPSAGVQTANVFVEPSAGRAPLLAAIAGARRSLDCAMYLFNDSTLATALVEAAHRGVQVRVLLERRPVGGEDPAANNRQTANTLQRAGIAVHWTGTSAALAHEKSLLVDGRQVLILTMNFTRAAFTTNREIGVIDDDPGDVREVAAIFAADWGGDRYTPAGADLMVSPTNSRPRLLAAIQGARRSLDLYVAFLRDRQMQDVLVSAARRGVQVRVVLADNAKNRQARTTLAAGGVHVRLVRSPIIHAKAMLIDGQQAIVGSQNLTAQSLDSNREIGVLIANVTTVRQLEAVFAADWSGNRAH